MSTETSPPGLKHQVTCTFTDLFKFKALAELPLTNLTFSKVLDGVGPWAGELNVEDSRMRQANWINATSVWRTALWIDIDGVPIYAGPTLGRDYDEESNKASLSGSDFLTYPAFRLQARGYVDYTDPEGHKWGGAPFAPTTAIAYWVLQQALVLYGSIPLRVARDGETPPEKYWVSFEAPLEQEQTVGSILTQMQEPGYLTGIDYGQDLSYENKKRVAQITLSYPRRGSIVNPHVIEIPNGFGLKYGEDGTSQANSIIELAGGTTDRTKESFFVAAIAEGYPLLEATVTRPALTGDGAGLIEAYLSGSLATKAFPVIAPTIKLPMFGEPSIFDLNVGDDVILRVKPSPNRQYPANHPRFPKGLSVRMRIVRIDCTIPDEGLPYMEVTLNLPPVLIPVEPPVTGGPPAKEKEPGKENEPGIETEPTTSEWEKKEKEREEEEARKKWEEELERKEIEPKELEEKLKKQKKEREARERKEKGEEEEPPPEEEFSDLFFEFNPATPATKTFSEEGGKRWFGGPNAGTSFAPIILKLTEKNNGDEYKPNPEKKGETESLPMKAQLNLLQGMELEKIGAEPEGERDVTLQLWDATAKVALLEHVFIKIGLGKPFNLEEALEGTPTWHPGHVIYWRVGFEGAHLFSATRGISGEVRFIVKKIGP